MNNARVMIDFGLFRIHDSVATRSRRSLANPPLLDNPYIDAVLAIFIDFVHLLCATNISISDELRVALQPIFCDLCNVDPTTRDFTRLSNPRRQMVYEFYRARFHHDINPSKHHSNMECFFLISNSFAYRYRGGSKGVTKSFL